MWVKIWFYSSKCLLKSIKRIMLELRIFELRYIKQIGYLEYVKVEVTFITYSSPYEHVVCIPTYITVSTTGVVTGCIHCM